MLDTHRRLRVLRRRRYGGKLLTARLSGTPHGPGSAPTSTPSVRLLLANTSLFLENAIASEKQRSRRFCVRLASLEVCDVARKQVPVKVGVTESWFTEQGSSSLNKPSNDPCRPTTQSFIITAQRQLSAAWRYYEELSLGRRVHCLLSSPRGVGRSCAYGTTTTVSNSNSTSSCSKKLSLPRDVRA